ncbi:hypothetical protein OTU49_000383, partial [Cherax quadricarinatus]
MHQSEISTCERDVSTHIKTERVLVCLHFNFQSRVAGLCYWRSSCGYWPLKKQIYKNPLHDPCSSFAVQMESYPSCSPLAVVTSHMETFIQCNLCIYYICID